MTRYVVAALAAVALTGSTAAAQGTAVCYNPPTHRCEMPVQPTSTTAAPSTTQAPTTTAPTTTSVPSASAAPTTSSTLPDEPIVAVAPPPVPTSVAAQADVAPPVQALPETGGAVTLAWFAAWMALAGGVLAAVGRRRT